MKAKFVCFKLSKLMILFFAIIVVESIFILIQLQELKETKNFEQIVQKIDKLKEEEKKSEENLVENEPKVNKETKKEYETMPSQLKGYKVVGKITIPKLKLDSCILEETSTKSLKVSVTKLYGPDINNIGNFCIAGHNYRNNKMFGGIKKLEKEDQIILTNTYGESKTYKVYKKYETDPKNVECLSQETEAEREVTLITCTPGAVKRVIVKAVEVYD